MKEIQNCREQVINQPPAPKRDWLPVDMLMGQTGRVPCGTSKDHV